MSGKSSNALLIRSNKNKRKVSLALAMDVLANEQISKKPIQVIP